jgi:hypothetical protein
MQDLASIRLDAGCDARNARVVRTVVAACAALEGFSIERLDDVRLLADELFSVAASSGAPRVLFEIFPGPGHIAIGVSAHRPERPDHADVELAFARLIADAIARDAELAVDRNRISFSLTVDAAPFA